MRTLPASIAALVVAACQAPNPAYRPAERPDAEGPAPDAAAVSRAPDGRPPPADAPVAAGDLRGSSGLVLHLPMDEAGGTDVKDASGNGHVGKLASAAAWGAGVRGGAVDSKVAGPIAIGASPALNALRAGVTVAAWTKPRTTTAYWSMVVSRQVAGTAEEYYGLGVRGAQAAFTTQYNVISTAPSPAPANVWVHLAGTYDGAVQRLYVDGKLVAMKAAVRSLTADTTPLIVGGNQNFSAGVTELFDGWIDEVRVYDRALGDAEVAALAAR